MGHAGVSKRVRVTALLLLLVFFPGHPESARGGGGGSVEERYETEGFGLLFAARLASDATVFHDGHAPGAAQLDLVRGALPDQGVGFRTGAECHGGGHASGRLVGLHDVAIGDEKLLGGRLGAFLERTALEGAVQTHVRKPRAANFKGGHRAVGLLFGGNPEGSLTLEHLLSLLRLAFRVLAHLLLVWRKV